MKAFRFKQFDIIQSENVFRVGTDGVLLGALARHHQAKNILEIGTGTGLISLMLAQRYPNTEILAIDIDKKAIEIAQQNFKNSPFSSRLQAIQQDFRLFSAEKPLDWIVSNPPYFEENSSTKDTTARQRISLDFPELIAQTALLLAKNGTFSVIIPSTFTKDFIHIAKKHSLFLIRKLNIYGHNKSLIKRHILEFSPTYKDTEEEYFSIEKAPRQYSDEYLEATKEFHLFKN